jgi:secreted Zn-dependent insulinase-like peptidase
MLHQVTMQYLDEPTFNQLRTIEQLGYVVFARKSDYRDVMGTQFIIQSPKYSSEYIVNSLNTFLDNQREKVKTLSEEDFKT